MSDSTNRITVSLSIEVVLMRRGGHQYHLVLSRLKNFYNCEIIDCYDNPQYLKNVLKEAYGSDYESIVEEIKLELGDSINEKGIEAFLAVLENNGSN